MTVMEYAKALGEAIAIDPVVKTLREAQEAYNSCRPLQDKLAEYNASRAAMGEEYKKDAEEQDAAIQEKLKNRLDELGREIVAFPEYGALSAAEKGLKDLMTRVNSEINFCVFGIRPEEENACTHDCATCGGCH